MVTLRGVWLTFKTVKNPWNVLLIYLDDKSRLVEFKQGFSGIMNRSAFLAYRKHILHGWKIKELDQLKQPGVLLSKNEFKIAAPRDISRCGMLFEVFDELEQYYRVFDFKDKVCLDVGGFIGETAILFKTWGAKKVIIYEPVSENCEFIEFNTAMNSVNAEIHCVGISDRDGTIEVNYDDISVDFGLKGDKKMIIPVVSASKVLTKGIDIAKFDCEGCEESLLNVSRDILTLIPNYIIEYHHHLGSKLMEKFLKCGFSVEPLSDPKKAVGIFKAWLLFRKHKQSNVTTYRRMCEN